MSIRAWAIKLGSGGQCIPFCERHQIVGVGWKVVDGGVLATAARDELARHVRETCRWYETERARGGAVGQLYRFGRECEVGDSIVYYDPPKKHVVIARVASGPLVRDFDLEDLTDVWHFRKVEYPIDPIPILDFSAVLKGRLLGPRMSFWQLRPAEIIDSLAKGKAHHLAAAPDPEIENAYRKLQELVLRRAEELDASDWEWLVVDYFKAQGAHVDERAVGGNRAIIDAEARFDHGELGEELWRIQVKRYQDQSVDWPTIEKDLTKVGDARFCFVSVYGFTADARTRAEEEGVRLLEAGDFVPFLLSGKVRERVRQKLRLPLLSTIPPDEDVA